MKTGEFLKHWRKVSGKTQECAALEYGIGTRTLIAWERGEHEPKFFDVLNLVTRVYGVDVEFGGRGIG